MNEEKNFYWEQSAKLLATSIREYLDLNYENSEATFRTKKFFQLVELPVEELIVILNEAAPNTWTEHQIQYIAYHTEHPEKGSYIAQLEGIKQALISRYAKDYDNYKKDLEK